MAQENFFPGFEEREKRKQQSVVITGAASGIGKECLIWFLREGYHCVGIDLNFGNFDDFRKSLSFNYNSDCLFLENCDVTKFEEFRSVIQKCEKNLDIFIV